MKSHCIATLGWRLLALFVWQTTTSTTPAQVAESATLETATIEANLTPERADFHLSGSLIRGSEEQEANRYVARLDHQLEVGRESTSLTSELHVQFLDRPAKSERLTLFVPVVWDSVDITGEGLAFWGMERWDEGAALTLFPEDGRRGMTITLSQVKQASPFGEALRSPWIRVEGAEAVSGSVTLQSDASLRLVPLALDGALSIQDQDKGGWSCEFREADFRLDLRVSDREPEYSIPQFEGLGVEGTVFDDHATLRVRGMVRLSDPKGGVVDLLGGEMGLTQATVDEGAWVAPSSKGYALHLSKNGAFSFDVSFDIPVRENSGWSRLSVHLPESTDRTVTLSGLEADDEFALADGVAALREEENWAFFLPPVGPWDLLWRDRKEEAEGALFYAVDARETALVGAGLLEQWFSLEYQILQGSLTQVEAFLDGSGEILDVEGESLLSWSVEPAETGRRLIAQLSSPQSGAYTLRLRSQSPLSAAPVEVTPMRVRPEGAIRFGGALRVVSRGAVTIEPIESNGLTQISPQRFPSAAGFPEPAEGAMILAYRYSGESNSVTLLADTIEPEINLSEALFYEFTASGLALQAEWELDILKAPIRELTIEVPGGFLLSDIQASALADYQFTPSEADATATLRLLFSGPIQGRRLISLRLERDSPSDPGLLRLPRLRAPAVDSERGSLGIAAETGLAIEPDTHESLIEAPNASFPRTVEGLQVVYRIQDADWTALVNLRRLDRTTQVDAAHLLSLGDGVAYGSALLDYLVTGAPLNALRIEAPESYRNVEIVGPGVRDWRLVDNAYEVALTEPVFGAATFLVTFDLPLDNDGSILALGGVRPLDVESERGASLLVSPDPMTVETTSVGSGVLELESAEIPAELRLLTDAPIIAAHQYSERPFDVTVSVRPSQSAATLANLVDRAVYRTEVSSDGEIATEATFFLKNQEASHLALTLPESADLWSLSVDGKSVMLPVEDGRLLAPIPARANPDELVRVEIAWADKVARAQLAEIELPALGAPSLATTWTAHPAPGRRLMWKSGVWRPESDGRPVSPWARWSRAVSSRSESLLVRGLTTILGLSVAGALLFRWGAHITSPAWRLTAGVVACLVVAGAGFVSVGLGLEIRPFPEDSVGPIVVEAPMAPAGFAPTMTLENRALDGARLPIAALSWMAVGLVTFAVARVRSSVMLRKIGGACGWAAVGVGLALSGLGGWPLGVAWALLLVVKVIAPGTKGLANLPKTPVASTVALLFGLMSSSVSSAQDWSGSRIEEASSQGFIQEDRLIMDAQWSLSLEAGEPLPLLGAQVAVTEWTLPPELAHTVSKVGDGALAHWVEAEQSGVFKAQARFEIPVSTEGEIRGFANPMYPAAIHRSSVTLSDTNFEIVDSDVASALRDSEDGRQWELNMRPVAGAQVRWRPRARDVSEEQLSLFCEAETLWAPGVGVVDGLSRWRVQIARGQLRALDIALPASMTVMDVGAQGLEDWRFSPEDGRLRLRFSAPMTGALTILARTQTPASAPPYSVTLRPPSVVGADGEVGVVGLATGRETQLENVAVSGGSPVNLEDFPGSVFGTLASEYEGLRVRRAYRYSQAGFELELDVAEVLSDVRASVRELVSVGVDRVSHSAQIAALIARRGVFSVSFEIPLGLSIESVTGTAVSHWTQREAADGQRVATVHFREKTEGQTDISVALMGLGPKSETTWTAPRIVLVEASKQTGVLDVVPERGLRLFVTEREGASTVSAADAGNGDSESRRFRWLRKEGTLQFGVERVDPRVRVESLLDAEVEEGAVGATVYMDYEIENNALDSLAVVLPPGAEAVRFTGPRVSGFALDSGASEDSTWRVQLDRRVLGELRIQAHYNVSANAEGQITLVGPRAMDADLQRAFATIGASGRLRASIDTVPSEARAIESRTIPEALRERGEIELAGQCFRLFEPDVPLTLSVERREVERALPARVQSASLTAIVSETGATLYNVAIRLYPQDKRSLGVTLPAGAEIWYASINQNPTSISEGNKGYQIGLERHPDESQPSIVEFVYFLPVQLSGPGFQMELLGPQFDLPLQNIEWETLLPAGLKLVEWNGRFELWERGDKLRIQGNVDEYLRAEASRKQRLNEQAELFLEQGSQYAQAGSQRAAREAFRNAYTLSNNNIALNEDARAQLQSVRNSQAIVGLNLRRQNAFAMDGPMVAPEEDALNYTPEQMRDILSKNTSDQNDALAMVAESLVARQDASLERPAPISAQFPRMGRSYTFRRNLQVDSDSEMRLELRGRWSSSSSQWEIWGLFGAFAVLLLVMSALAPQSRARSAS